jgi:NadR type nicotinamide-nucleotide adenylyltransferase
MLKKIVIIGPESTGKSTLSAQLAVHYKTLWCPEYAREYLLEHGTSYAFEDLLTIAKGQLALEDEYVASMVNEKFTISNSSIAIDHLPIFIDTDMYVMKVWCEYVFGKCHQFILGEIAQRKYDLYLLCNIDHPWMPDEQREHPDETSRKELYNIYEDIMINQETPWVDISGSYEERLKKGIVAVDAILSERTRE